MNNIVLGVLSSGTGTVFLAAAAAKSAFRVSIAPFLLAVGLPTSLASWMARATPVVEGLVGVLLLGAWLPSAALLASALSIGFFLALLQAYKKGVQEGCRCFGALDTDQLSGLSLVRTGLLVAATLVLSSGVVSAGISASLKITMSHDIVTTTVGILVGIAFVGVFALLEQVWWFEGQRPRTMPPPAVDTL